MTELKPCPLCGYEPNIIYGKGDIIGFFAPSSNGVVVRRSSNLGTETLYGSAAQNIAQPGTHSVPNSQGSSSNFAIEFRGFTEGYQRRFNRAPDINRYKRH